ncbi:hypothetical protein L1987_25207 [Smallanthus sonchifolius]|uniref:Uncharacterized protein n=1 Tax=Smallanthus sonchifolius TaxID=185202 RepID=A0ACB9IN51_9ASTR|nr:hypothetical protein L1987_25207 [Smallanthus sonchifolius]
MGKADTPDVITTLPAPAPARLLRFGLFFVFFLRTMATTDHHQAGVWRIKALEDCSGWLERTTVEDMDNAVRAHLHDWKMIFLNDVKCQCELPESYEAYRKQQHRWHSGLMQLFRLWLPDIIKSKLFDVYLSLRSADE